MPSLNILRTEREVRDLREENQILREQVGFLQRHPTLAKGLKGELIVAKVVRGAMIAGNAPYDVLAKRGRFRLEVKYSGLLVAVRGCKTRRWVWTKLFGESGRKNYDRLILVGLADQRFSRIYKDRCAPFVLFDVPITEVVELSFSAGKYRAIHLTTNPLTARSVRSSKLFGDYQVTASGLRARYGV
jgi:hypothetical protein